MTLKEMPKVGDTIRYVGKSDRIFTDRAKYNVEHVVTECATVLDDYGNSQTLEFGYLSRYFEDVPEVCKQNEEGAI